jgi:hypothetical protein
MIRQPRTIFIALCAAVVASCGGGGGSSPASPPPAPASLQIAVSGMAIVKLQATAAGIVAMEQRLTAITEPGPDHALALFDTSGNLIGRYAPPPGFALIDFTQHPSGAVTVALATATTVRLARIDHVGGAVDELALVDPQASTDPFFDDGGLHDDNSLVPVLTRDAVRVAAMGEDVAVALRTGRNATVAYRFNHAQPGGYARAWRTLVEPGFSMFLIGITSGTFDTFDGLASHLQLRLDADGAGNIAVAVPSREQFAPLFAAHSRLFGGAIQAANGAIVTRLAPDGSRAGSSVVDTGQTSELHGLRLDGDDVAVVGRVFTARRADGGGWDAYAARVSRISGAVTYRVIDVDLGEILFDIAPLPQGRFLVAGSAGYTQNPDGASVSEQASPLLAVLESDGTLRSRIAFAPGPRQTQLRSLAQLGGRWIVAGMTNGPGTHSGDGNRAAIVADGFARETPVSP